MSQTEYHLFIYKNKADRVLVTKLKYQLSEHWGVFGGGVFISASETGADWGDSFSGAALGGEVRLDDRNGNRINKHDYDPSPYVELRLVGGF